MPDVGPLSPSPVYSGGMGQDTLQDRVRATLKASGFSDEEIECVFVDTPPEPAWVPCTSLTEVIQNVKGHYQRHGGEVVQRDDPMAPAIGYAIDDHWWCVRVSDLKHADDPPIYRDLLRTAAGRQQIAKLIMTAARSEPPPPMG